mmetsp:Transcript_12990/g.19712  ORF Transcript_12990/g.19712 Transcript_12990/m.19712 type:complete len:176 (+) Transcript_12990:101-628(+)
MMAQHSMIHRNLFEQFVFNPTPTDIRFFNDTDREVLFVIADEEFSLTQTTNTETHASIGENDESFPLPFSLSTQSKSLTETKRSALRTRFMPVAPQSNSSQYFSKDRLTYVTALTKEENGKDKPWTRIHYENKVINCKQSKQLRFTQKHLKISAWTLEERVRNISQHPLKITQSP